MIRKTTNGDISDDEFEAVLKPFLDDYDNFIYSYVMPEIIAYYIANAFNRNSMYSGTFNQHYNSAKDLINLFGEDYEQVKDEIYKLLKAKYTTRRKVLDAGAEFKTKVLEEANVK